jgi:NADH-quinone oxidoreductase subunit D
MRVVTSNDSDVLARLTVIREQVSVSVDLIEACVERLQTLEGPINVTLPKTLRAPEGIHYGWTEAPLGIGGYLVASQGEKTPWRVKLRTPSFAHTALLSDVLVGASTAHLAPIIGSLFLVTGDTDR